MEDFLREVFDFYPTEKAMTSLDDDGVCIGTWMTSNNQIHQFAG